MAEKKRRRRLQISLRTMLIVITIVCLALAYDVRYRRQHLAADQLRNINGKISYHTSALDWLPLFGHKLRDVEAVDLAHCRIDSENIELLLRFPRIERLYLSRTATEDEDLAVISRLRQLKRLSLWGTGISNEGIQELVALKNLEVLDIHANRRVWADALEWLVKLPKLQVLKSDFEAFDDRHLELLAQMHPMPLGEFRCVDVTDAGLRSLGKLNPNNFSIVGFRNAKISDDAFLALEDNGILPVGPNLKLDGSTVSDRILPMLPWDRLAGVRFLKTFITYDAVVKIVGDRIKMFNIGEKGYGLVEDWDWSLDRGWAPVGLSVWIDQDPVELSRQQLAKIPNLTGVYLYRREPGGDLLERLDKHTQLKRFEMSAVPAATPVIEQISNWKQLKHVKLNCCNPRTSFDITPLAKLPRLRHLLFSCTPFGDEAFETIGQLSQLREFDITSAHKVTGKGLKHLQDLAELDRLTIQSTANWDDSIDDLMSLDQIKRIHLIDVVLSEENKRRFEARKGWWHQTWR